MGVGIKKPFALNNHGGKARACGNVTRNIICYDNNASKEGKGQLICRVGTIVTVKGKCLSVKILFHVKSYLRQMCSV